MADDRELPLYLARMPLDSIVERELDLLLLAELHASPSFVRFVMAKITDAANVRFVGAWRGVVDAGGETDLLLLCDVEGHGRTAVMIEDKIDAIFQDSQADRYRRRGEAGIREGAWDKFYTCLCAPERYLAPYRRAPDWDACIALEEVASWLEEHEGGAARASFLRTILMQAAAKHGQGGFVPDDRATSFWLRYKQFCNDRYPTLRLEPLNPVQSRNEPWPRFAVPTLPTGVQVQHKPRQGCIDLTFNGETIEAAKQRAEGLGLDSPAVVRVGGSAAVRVAAPPVDHLQPFDGQFDAVHTALRAAERLMIDCGFLAEPAAACDEEELVRVKGAIDALLRELSQQSITASDGNHSARIGRVAENILSHLASGKLEAADDRVCHAMSRVGVFARSAATDLRTGHINAQEAAVLLEQLAKVGDVAFSVWMRDPKFQHPAD